MKKRLGQAGQKGMALLITLLILAVLSIMATTMVTNMTLDQKTSSNVNTDISAQYIAMAGLNHAIGVLRDDLDFINSSTSFESYDWNTENSFSDDWKTVFSGSDVDIADTISRSTGDLAVGTPDAKWIYLHQSPGDAGSPVIGRYAVLIEDENARMNINAVGSDFDSVEAAQEGVSTVEIDLRDLFENISGVTVSLADLIAASSMKPFAELEELRKISGIDDATYTKIAPYLTLYSADHDMYYDLFGTPVTYYPRINVNYETRLNYLKEIFTRMFWADSRKDVMASINIIDYRDENHVPSVYTESELGVDMNGSGSVSSLTNVYGVEGIQINELLTQASVVIEANDTITGSYIIEIDSGNFTRNASYFNGLSVDETNKATAVLEIPWDNGQFKVVVYSSAEVPNDSVSCRVEGVGYFSVPAGGSLQYIATVADGILTIELEDPLQYDGMGGLAATQTPSKVEKIEIIGGDYIEIVNISRESITLTTDWTFVCDNGTPADTSDDRAYHLPSDVTLSGVTYTSTMDPVTVTYDYLVLTNSPKLVEMAFDSVVDGVWNGDISVLLNSSGNPLFDLLDVGESITIKNGDGDVIDHISKPDNNEYSVKGYISIAAKISREKRSPELDMDIDSVTVWDSSTTAGNSAGHFGTPGAQNTLSGPSYVTVRDDDITNAFFMYDLPKNEYINNPAGALTNAETIYTSIYDKIGFDVYTMRAEDYYQKTSWTLMGGASNYLALSNGVTSGAKISAHCDYSGNNIPDGEYRLFLKGLQSGEIHSITGTYLDTGSSTILSKTVSVTTDESGLTCLNGVYSSSADELLPFSVENALFSLVDNCDASTPTTQNTADEFVLQPVGFDPVLAGKINVNTADVKTIQALPGVDSTLAQAIVTQSLSSPFNRLTDLLMVTGLSFSQYCKIANLVTVRSSNFRVHVVGQVIRDVNKNGSYDAGDVVVGEKRCAASVYRSIERDDTANPSAITMFTRSFDWDD
ncbi:MAG: helix-hairpin-helix domain-containing protein [Candidatus Auribacterota bacterium]